MRIRPILYGVLLIVATSMLSGCLWRDEGYRGDSGDVNWEGGGVHWERGGGERQKGGGEHKEGGSGEHEEGDRGQQ